MDYRIGIRTFHNVPNYGASLQAFALKHYLEKSTKSTVNVIDYRCPGNSDEFLPKNYFKSLCKSSNPLKSLIKKICVDIFYKKSYNKKYKGFADFNDAHLCVTPNENIYEKFDFVFCGSDQIWNPVITEGFKDAYFGADKPEKSKTVVSSFSASCGDISEFSETEKEILFAKSRSLHKVGVRESTLANELQNNGIDAVNTVDPTFLVTAEEYSEAFGLKPCEQKRYVLEYALRPDSQLDVVAEYVAKQKGLSVKKVCGYVGITKENGIFDATPQDFINLVDGAAYIVTNSFHGTAFSVIFSKNFNAVLPPARKGRVTDLLNMLGLENRVCNSIENCDYSEIDYRKPKAVLEEKINASKLFIQSVISERGGINE